MVECSQEFPDSLGSERDVCPDQQDVLQEKHSQYGLIFSKLNCFVFR